MLAPDCIMIDADIPLALPLVHYHYHYQAAVVVFDVTRPETLQQVLMSDALLIAIWNQQSYMKNLTPSR